MKDLTSSVYSFEDLRNGNFLYVDKTEFLWELIRPAYSMYFFSRPRRFGKSLTVSTLKAIFQGKKELFKGLAIYDKPYDWKQYPVIHLDMNGWDFSSVEILKQSFCGIIREQATENGVQVEDDNPTAMFQKLIEKLSADGSDVVVLLDEYDKPILDNITKPNAQEYLKALKAFYSVIKAKADRIRLAFVTGVIKFCYASEFSDLNNLLDISMNADYATMLGYTQQELEQNFAEWIDDTAGKQNLSRDEYLAQIKSWYDGYKFDEKSESVYNPVALANFFINGGKFHNYWFETGTPTLLLELIKSKRMNLERAISEPVSFFAFGAFEIDNVDPLMLSLQTGYLTIKSSVMEFGEAQYQLDFPNREVSESFNLSLLNAYVNTSQGEVSSFCSQLSRAVVAGDLPKFQQALEVFFAGIPYDVHCKSEANFQNIFFAIFKLLGYNIHAESRTSDDKIDAVLETDKYVYLFEFKLNQDDSALSQIKEKEYFKPYLLSPKKITLVGANFSTETGKISNWQTDEVSG